MYFSVPLYWWYHTTLFCKEHVIPLWAENSYFACLLKTEQRKCLCLCNEILRAQWFHTFDVYLNSSMSVKALRSWQRIIKKKYLWRKNKTKMKYWNSAQEERELWTRCLSVFFCVFVWGDEWEFPVPPPCYLSPECGQTHCIGWRKVEFVDFERGKREKNLPCFELSQQQHTQQSYLSRVCMGIGM